MCTLSFWPTAGGGYLLLHNRDELRSRAAAVGPRIVHGARVPTLAPRDGEAHGTWFAVDAEGRTLCVLNGPENAPPRLPLPRSRGLLAADLALDLRREPCIAALEKELAREPYRPFVFAHVERAERGATLALLRWDGRDLARRVYAARHLETSSGPERALVHQRRAARFAELVPALERLELSPLRRALWSFHHEHRAEAPLGDAYSPCMHRSEASTRGVCLVDARPARTAFFHRPGQPCQREPIEVHRARAGARAEKCDWTSPRRPS